MEYLYFHALHKYTVNSRTRQQRDSTPIYLQVFRGVYLERLQGKKENLIPHLNSKKGKKEERKKKPHNRLNLSCFHHREVNLYSTFQFRQIT